MTCRATSACRVSAWRSRGRRPRSHRLLAAMAPQGTSKQSRFISNLLAYKLQPPVSALQFISLHSNNHLNHHRLPPSALFPSHRFAAMAAMQLNASVALPATGIAAVPLSSSSSARVHSTSRVTMRPLVAVRAESESQPASGGTTDKAGYAQTNAGGSGASDLGSFANDVVEGVADKTIDAQKGVANLGSEAQENLPTVGKELKDGVGELVDDTKTIVDKATKNPGQGN